ncbi:MAG: flagellar protein FlaG [Colwellia sp.]|nr:flagellar protein FlaG [Colwellia sp.]
MSVIQSGVDLGTTKLTPEYANKANSESNVSLAQGKTITQQEIVAADVDKAEDKQPLTAEQLENVAQQLQDFVGNMNRGLEFSVDKDSGRDVIKVIDKNSGDLVKQFPSEEVLSLVAKLSDMVGGFIDAKV